MLHRPQHTSLLLVAAISPFLGVATVRPQQAAWPAPRARHHLAYDSASHLMLLLGGAQPRPAGAGRDTTLWGWDGTTWHALLGAPPPRANEAVAFDANRQHLVLHGGSGPLNDTERDETWEWDGQSWRLRSTTGPGARAHHALTYDPAHHQIILFGNSDDATDSETWGWDGQRWTLLARDGPPRRGVYGLAFNTTRAVAVLFGGYGSQNVVLNDTWEWDGSHWTQIRVPLAPSPRWDTALAYDSSRDRIVLFGGHGTAGDVGDTWEFDGHGWTPVAAEGPSPRNGHAMAYDPQRKAIILFGGRTGQTYFNDMWAFDGRWTRLWPK